uniref:NAD(P)-dependent oxidoreductase n=1 Tax=Tepidiforma sp. TaxID=2682230 RepID=UPI002ADE79B8
MSILIELLPSAGPALVVGGGAIASRKVATLLDGGFTVTVIAPEFAPELAADPRLDLHPRPFADADLDARPWA